MRFGDLEQVAESRTVNISQRGLYVRMSRPRPIGTQVQFELQLGSGERFHVEGVVVRTVPDPDDPSPDPQALPGMGVFLTSTCAGWTRFVEELESRREDQAAG